ncbi:MAG: Ig-like domain-containing protein [Betaproteobacteria bacterium]|jgi:hypothetical protein
MSVRLPTFRLSACALATTALVAACGGGDAGPPPDTLAPTVSITSNASGTVKGDVTYTFTFSEDVGTSFTADDVTVTGGTKAASVTKASATGYTLVVTPTANTTGSIAVSVAASKFSDAANNANTAAASAAAVAFDTQAPTAQISSNVAGTATGPVTLTFTFSEDVGTSFTADDVTLTGGTKAAAVTKVNATTYTLVATPTAGASGNMTAAIAASAFSDAVGNANTAAPVQFSQAYNTVVRTTVVRALAADAPAYDQASGNALPGNYVTGRYAPGAGEMWWWGGNYPEQIQSGYGFSNTNTQQWGFGIFIANGGTGWDIANATRYGFTLGSNGECANVCTVTVRLVSKVDAACVADYRVKLTSADITTAYTANLADFTVKGCTTNTVAAFKGGKVAELHFQLLRNDMQYTAGTDGNGNYANGLGVGGNIYFE